MSKIVYLLCQYLFRLSYEHRINQITRSKKVGPMHFVALILILGLHVLEVMGHGAMVSPLSRNAIGKEKRLKYLPM